MTRERMLQQLYIALLNLGWHAITTEEIFLIDGDADTVAEAYMAGFQAPDREPTVMVLGRRIEDNAIWLLCSGRGGAFKRVPFNDTQINELWEVVKLVVRATEEST